MSSRGRPLPRLLVLADSTATRGRPLETVVADAVRGGARAVVLRDKHLPRAARLERARRLGDLLGEAGGILLVASDATIPAGGVHLAAADPFPSPRPARVGRSCHDRDEVARAAAEGCDYATLSPIFATSSKPGYGPALGTGILPDLPLPTWALGGITPANAAACIGAGAAGVAVMGAVMGAPDPAGAVAHLLEALDPA